MRRVLSAILFILIAVFGILYAAGMLPSVESAVGEISVFSMVAGACFLYLALDRLLRRLFLPAMVHLSILVIIFEDNLAVLLDRPEENLINNGVLILCAVLLGIGLSMLFPKHSAYQERSRNHIGSHTVYIDCVTFKKHGVENNMGSTTVRFENVEHFTGGKLDIENNMGSTVVCVPREWRLECNMESNIAALNISSNEFSKDPQAPCLQITGDNNMGSLTVKAV